MIQKQTWKDETGTDGEPLIKNVKILKKLQLWKQKI